MLLDKDDVQWVKRGRQRSAVAAVLRKPMTTGEICRAARSLSPRIQLRDIWLILRDMARRRIVMCLNPRYATGKLYTLTERGRNAAHACFGADVHQPRRDIDWRKYAQIARAATRKTVLLELNTLTLRGPVTATTVKKSLHGKHPIGLNATIRALRELCRLGVVSSIEDPTGVHRRYQITTSGQRIAVELTR